MKVLSEPLLQNVAEMDTQVYPEMTKQPLDPLVVAAKETAYADPTDPDNWVKLGRLYRRQKMHRSAINAYSLGMTYDPFNWFFFRHKGHTYLNLGQPREAAAAFTMATRLHPTNWDSWYHLGLAYYMLNELDKAEACYRETLRHSPTYKLKIPLVNWYYLTLLKQGKKEEAEKLAKIIPPDVEANKKSNYYKLAMVYNGTVDVNDALAEAEAFLQKDPENHMSSYPSNTYGLAWKLIYDGEVERGFEILKRGYETHGWALADTALEFDMARWQENGGLK